MFKALTKLFKKNNGKLSKNNIYGMDNLEDDVIGYPPDPQGIPVVQPNVLLTRMMKDVNFIKTEIGLSGYDFDKYVLPVMINFIEFVDLLPASEFKHHATGGGLVYHSFDVAKRAMRAAQHTQFPANQNITDTQRSFIHWKVATVIAALLHDTGKVITDMVISNGAEKKEDLIIWNANDKEIVWAWAKRNQIERFYISWTSNRHNKHKNATINIIQRLIPTETWTWLTNCLDGANIYTAMLSSIGNEKLDHPMNTILTECDSASVRDDMLNKNSHITKEMKRIPLSVLMSDLIKHRILIGDWEINHRGAPVWYVSDELYITWEACAEELVNELKDAGYVIPELPIMLARIMIEEGIAIGSEEDPYCNLSPEILGEPNKPVILKVLKFKQPARFVNDLNKLYSINEHKKAVDKREREEKEANIEKRRSAQSSIETASMKKQKQFESSIETISRILPMINTPKTEIELETHTESINESAQYVESDIEADIKMDETIDADITQSINSVAGGFKESNSLFMTPEAQLLHKEMNIQIQDGKLILTKEVLTEAQNLLIKNKVSSSIFESVDILNNSKEIRIDG